MSDKPNSHKSIPYAFTTMPEWVMTSPKISLTLKGFLSVLAMWARPARGKHVVWPGLATIAKNMGTSESAVTKNLKKCQDLNLITRERRTGTSSLTTLHYLVSAEEALTSAGSKDADMSGLVPEITTTEADVVEADVYTDDKDPIDAPTNQSRVEKQPSTPRKKRKVTISPELNDWINQRLEELHSLSPHLGARPPSPELAQTIAKAYFTGNTMKENPFAYDNWLDVMAGFRDWPESYKETTKTSYFFVKNKTDGEWNAVTLMHRGRKIKPELGSWEVELADSPV